MDDCKVLAVGHVFAAVHELWSISRKKHEIYNVKPSKQDREAN